ncbi:hypothetical protein JCM11491_004202 [Sporobolomyces phaffii]
MRPPSVLGGDTPAVERVTSPLAMSPSLPFPSSPTSPAPPPLARSRTAPLRSPRTSQDSSSSSKRFSVASVASTASSTSVVQRPLVLMRTRHASLPASVVQSIHQSIVGTPAANHAAAPGNRVTAVHRISVASVASFGSVEEETEHDTGATAAEVSSSPSIPAPSRSTSLSAPSGNDATNLLRPKLRASSARHSLPVPGQGLPSFISILDLSGSQDRSSVPPKRKSVREYGVEEQAKRAEKRLRIAEELRDSEKAYVRVLEEIDANFYQPLLRALPPGDPFSRRASNRFSSTTTSPNSSPRSSAYDPSPRLRTLTSDSSPSSAVTTPSTAPSSPPSVSTDIQSVLNRRELNEIFSNFTDVLNLSHVMLLTLAEAIPERPSAPVSISSLVTDSVDGLHSSSGSVEPRSSSSGGTLESLGPATPPDHDAADIHSSSRPRIVTEAQTTSRAPRRRNPAPPLRLGKTLLPIVPFFRQYSLFVANFSGSLARLSQLERDGHDQKWQSFFRTRKMSSQAGKIGLGGMLLNIVQRVPRYRLLLLELLESTDQEHPDLKDLETAFALVDSVATHLDAQIESHTHDLAILNLQRVFTDLDFPLLSPGRRLLKSGPLRKFNRSGKEQTRAFFLFSDVLVHAAPVEQGVPWGLGISGVTLGGDAPPDPTSDQSYRFVDKFGLEDVTVVATEEGQLRYGFEILSTRKSFAVYADSLETRASWLEAVRDAKAALMSDRGTLQRATIHDSVSTRATNPSTKSDRQIPLSLPDARAPGGPVVLGTIPPTPADELESLEFPASPANPRNDIILPSMEPRPPAAGSGPRASTSTSSSVSPGRRPSLARTRRWSEMRPSDAVQAIASALLPAPPGTVREDSSVDRIEYKVIETYHAPVWVPDSKAKKCLRCAQAFGLWRRKHHCRLCGGVVCWACSTNYFIIPADLLSSSTSTPSSSGSLSSSVTTPSPDDQLARSCDTCFTAVFDDPVPSSRFLGSTTPAATFGRSTLQPCVDSKTATLHRLSRVIDPRRMPLFDELVPAGADDSRTSVAPSSPRTGPTSSSPSAVAEKRRRRLTAVGTLQSLLANQP